MSGTSTLRKKRIRHYFENGFYSEETGDERVVYDDNQVGFKRILRSYHGVNLATGTKTGWILHEYRVESNQHRTWQWVMCKLVRTPDPSRESSQRTSSGKHRTFRIGKQKYALLKEIYERTSESSQGTSQDELKSSRNELLQDYKIV